MPATRVARKKPTTTRKPVAKAKKAAPARKATAPTRKVAAAKPAPKPKVAIKRGMSFQEKAQMLHDYAKENGWWAKLEMKPIIKLVAKKDDGRYKDTIQCEWTEETGGSLNLLLEGGRSIRFRNLAAVRAHMDGSRVLKRDVKRKERKQRVKVGLGGEIIHRKGDEDYKPIGADIIDTFYHIQGRGSRNSGLAPVNVGPLFKPQAEGLKETFEADGYTVTLVKHEGGSCEVCSAAKPVASKPARKVPTKAPSKRKATRRSDDGPEALKELLRLKPKKRVR